MYKSPFRFNRSQTPRLTFFTCTAPTLTMLASNLSQYETLQVEATGRMTKGNSGNEGFINSNTHVCENPALVDFNAATNVKAGETFKEVFTNIHMGGGLTRPETSFNFSILTNDITSVDSNGVTQHFMRRFNYNNWAQLIPSFFTRENGQMNITISGAKRSVPTVIVEFGGADGKTTTYDVNPTSQDVFDYSGNDIHT